MRYLIVPKTKTRHAKNITEHKEINACIRKFYKNLFKKNVCRSDSEKESFLNSTALPNFNPKIFDRCDSEITEKDLITSLKIMPDGKYPGNDGLAKTFYEHCLNNLRFYFVNSQPKTV